MRTPNYDKFPSTKFEGFILQGWNAIKECLKAASKDAVLAVDLYTGTFGQAP